MPIKHSYIDNTLTNPLIEDAYAVVSEFHFDLDHKQIVFSYNIYRDEDAYKNKREKIATEVIRIDDAHHDAIYGAAELITPAVDEVLDGDGNVVTPAIPAVYGDPILLKAAIPSFTEVLSSNIPTYINLAKAIYDVALTQTTTFKDAIFIAPSGYAIR